MVTTADTWLTELFGDPGPGVALLAVGAYGRLEPAFGSDLDLVLVHDGSRSGQEIAELADRIWYPVWDSGIPLDHSVRTVPEALAVADGDLKAAMGLLDARRVVGDGDLAARLVSDVRARWRAKAGSRLPELAESVNERMRTFGEVAFLLEPDLKEARGGLRDITAVRALAAAWVADPPDLDTVAAAEVLLDVRGELHRRTGRDKLLLQEQPGVAEALGLADANELGLAVAAAGRKVAYAWNTAWYRAQRAIKPAKRWGGRKVVRRGLDEGVVEHDGEVTLALAAKPAEDPGLVLRVARAAAVAELPIAPHTLERLRVESAPMPVPWPPEAREAFVGMLAAGRPAVGVVEQLDHAGILTTLLPEWEHVRSRPQRNPYHRYTVDRHLVEAATNAAALTRSVSRPDLLLVGTLLHDIGKGLPGDHSVVGAGIAARIAERMGFDAAGTAAIVTIARHHLLLPDTATRRDLEDPETARFVASVVDDPGQIELLAAVAEADGRATGPTAWSPWKAQLIADLSRRTKAVLAGAAEAHATQPLAPTELQLQRIRRDDGRFAVTLEPDDHHGACLVVTGPDQAGLMTAVTGVVALHRLDVRRASATSDSGHALIELKVQPRHGDDLPSAKRLGADVAAELAGSGRPVAERLTEQESAYPRRRSPLPPAPPEVRFENRSTHATVVEVRAPDGPGVLYRILRALQGTDVDIRTAIVSTIGADVVDAFYVRGPDGGPVTGRDLERQIRQAVLDALEPRPIGAGAAG